MRARAEIAIGAQNGIAILSLGAFPPSSRRNRIEGMEWLKNIMRRFAKPG